MLSWLDFRGYSAAALSIGLLMFFIGFSEPGREYILFPSDYIYYIFGLVGALLVGHGLFVLYKRSLHRERRRNRLTNSMIDYFRSGTGVAGLPDLVTEGEEIQQYSYRSLIGDNNGD